MFTGIIATIGKVVSLQAQGGDMRLVIASNDLDLSDVKLGDSIANNGVCLTVVAIGGGKLTFYVSAETIKRTSLANLVVGSAINLEKALAVGDRLGGHFVSGHVDGVAKVILRQVAARSVIFRFQIPTDLKRYIAEKGSICIDGTSLTVNAVADNWFEVNIIPHTMQQTIINDYQIGTQVNIEVDLIARYLEQLLPEQALDISREKLMDNGFIK